MTFTSGGREMSSDQAGMDLLSRGPVDLLGEDVNEEDWREIFDMMREPMDEDLLSPIAAAMPAPVPATAGRPPKGAKRMTAYGYPTWREVAPEPYFPRPTRTRGKGVGVPEAARKRTCIDLSAQLTDSESDGEPFDMECYGTPGIPQWRWGAEFIVRPNNGWVEVVEVY